MRYLALILAIAVSSMTLVTHFLMKDIIAGPVEFNRIYDAAEFGLEAKTVSLRTEDDLLLEAYEVRVDSPQGVVIFLSGIHNPSVTAFYGHAKMLLEDNYASLLLEMRAHGESEGDLISLGFKEHLDVAAALDYIKAEKIYQDVPVIVFGLSMGGATAINAMGTIEELAGLVSLSAYSAWEDVFTDNMRQMGISGALATLQKPFVQLYNTIRFGFNSSNLSPKVQIQNLGTRPALLIHSTEDSQIPFVSFERLVEKAPAHIETWVREGDYHFILKNDDFLFPTRDTEYQEVIRGFFARHFGSN